MICFKSADKRWLSHHICARFAEFKVSLADILSCNWLDIFGEDSAVYKEDTWVCSSNIWDFRSVYKFDLWVLVW